MVEPEGESSEEISSALMENFIGPSFTTKSDYSGKRRPEVEHL